MNSLLLALTALLIVVLSALFAAPLFIDWNDYRHVFETQATKLLGRDVKVGGKVHLILLPAPELKFDQVKVADEDGRLDEPFLEAQSIEAWLNIGALLSGAVEARKIVIVDPILRLDLKADGTGNWRDVGRPGVALPFAPKDVMLDQVSVSGGRIEIARNGTEKLALNAVEGELSAASLSGPYKVSATYDYQGRRQELRFSTSEPDASGLFRVKAALRDPERNASYVIDGSVTGLGGHPAYDGNFTLRVASAGADGPPPVPTDLPDETHQDPASGKPTEQGIFVELKGALKATPDRAELPEFDLTVHTHGRSQILKGSLALDLQEPVKAEAKLAARFVDLDLLFGAPGAERRPSPAAILYMIAEEALTRAAAMGEGALEIGIGQASLGGDLVGNLDLAVTGKDGVITLERLAATLPGDNRVDVSGRLAQGAIGPVFTGPIKLKGTGLRALTRWAAGDRDMSGQASVGEFAFQADTTIGDGELKLADAQGEVSGTAFSGALRYRGGAKALIELNLDSDRLDLREMLSEGPVWRLPTVGAQDSPEGRAPDFLAQFRDDDMRVTLNVGELLLPHIPPGKLDARFTLLDGTLDIERLDFAADDEIAVTGKGRIERLGEAPAGRADFGLKAATAGSLRIVSELFGLPEDVSRSEHLSVLAPLDVHGALVASREGATSVSLELGGHAGGSAIALTARANGDPQNLAEAEIDIGGSVTGERPQALLVLLFPNLPMERFAKTGDNQGTLSLKLEGVPTTQVAGRVALETASMRLALDGEGALRDDGIALTGKLSLDTEDASLALLLAGLEAPPSAAVPMKLAAGLSKRGDRVELAPIEATIGGEPVEGTATFDLGGDKTRFTLEVSAGSISLPSLLGVLVAWQRTPSTEEMLGTIAAATSDVWPSRGFSLGVIERSEGEMTLKAKTVSLGAPFQVSDATLLARIDKDGLSVTDLKGRLFGGAFTASGTLAPRGSGAAFEAKAAIADGKLEDLSKSLAGKGLAKGPFDLTVRVQGEGLSPTGLVAGLAGEGKLSLGRGALQALTPEPLRRVAATAAKKIKVNQKQIAAVAKAVRDKVTKGLYKYEPAEFPFEVKNGTVRFTPATLAGADAETKVNAYVELASLKLDSEWEMSLAGTRHRAVPPVSLVFVGSLSDAGQIAPAIDTAAIEAFLTMRRMQEDVERLETLDVTGRTQPEAEPEPEESTPAEAIQMPVPDAARERAAAPATPAALPEAVPPEPGEPPAPPAGAASVGDPAQPAEAAVSDDEAQPSAAVVPEDRQPPRPARRRAPREAPDAWKKGIGIFGG